MAAFHLLVSDEQVEALEPILRALETAGSLPEALEHWPAMLRGLPREEAESPGCLHGFCL